MKTNIKKSKRMKTIWALIAAIAVMVMMPITASAHCDTMDGPTVADGKKAMESNNVNYALKWVQPEYEEELTQIFNLSMKVKDLSPEAKELSEKYFLENLVRLHRAGEGAPFTGLKPSGTPIDEKVLAADKSIEVGNLSPLENMIEKDKMPELQERFEKVMALKNFDVNDVEAGRKYIEAYVKFFKFAEGEEDEAHGAADAHGAVDTHDTVDTHEAANIADSHEAGEEESSTDWIPWTLAGLFFVTTVVALVKLKHSSK
jgi:hypothetical protein